MLERNFKIVHLFAIINLTNIHILEFKSIHTQKPVWPSSYTDPNVMNIAWIPFLSAIFDLSHISKYTRVHFSFLLIWLPLPIHHLSICLLTILVIFKYTTPSILSLPPLPILPLLFLLCLHLLITATDLLGVYVDSHWLPVVPLILAVYTLYDNKYILIIVYRLPFVMPNVYIRYLTQSVTVAISADLLGF